VEATRPLLVQTPRSLNYLLLFFIIFITLFYFICSSNFLSFYHNLSNVKIMFAKINLALIHLRHKLLLLFLKLTQSSLTKIQHQVKF
jgi:hypothetical protein